MKLKGLDELDSVGRNESQLLKFLRNQRVSGTPSSCSDMATRVTWQRRLPGNFTHYTFDPQKMPDSAAEKITSVWPGMTKWSPFALSCAELPEPVRICSLIMTYPPPGKLTVWLIAPVTGIAVPFIRRFPKNAPSVTGGLFAAIQVA